MLLVSLKVYQTHKMTTNPASALKYLFFTGGKAENTSNSPPKSLQCTLNRRVAYSVSEVNVASACMLIFTNEW